MKDKSSDIAAKKDFRSTDSRPADSGSTDLQFLQKRFEEDGLTVPASLSTDAIGRMLASDGAGTSARSACDSSGVSSAHPATSSSSGNAPGSRKRRWARPLIGLAACAVLVIALIPAMQTVLPSTMDQQNGVMDSSSSSDVPAFGSASPEASADSDGLTRFSSYDELDRKVASILSEQNSSTGSNYYFHAQEDMAGAETEIYEDSEEELSREDTDMDQSAAAADAASPDAAAPVTGSQKTESQNATGAGSDTSSADSSNPQHSSTYTQVEGIDEADIVKTDGKYIYYLSTIENQIIIARAKEGKTKRVSAVSGSSRENGPSYINDIYIRDDLLLVIGAGECQRTGGQGVIADATVVTVYDISDRTNPKEISSYAQTGTLLSSRLIDDRLVLVTNDVIYSYSKNSSLPYVSFDGETPRKLPIGHISCFPRTAEASFTVIGMFDLSTGKASKDTVKTKAVMGGSNEIYCNGKNLYVTSTIYGDASLAGDSNPVSPGLPGGLIPEEDPMWSTGGSTDKNRESDWQPRTQVLKVSLAGGKVKYTASAIVTGSVNNQFSMDERDGYLRIATTSLHNGEDVNNLYILDKKMKQVGACVGFARDEHIEAVRYVKDKAYVITYRQTDPLFIIDLSDPTDPVIEGHVKISGFSTLLVPSGADHLLGLGFSTEENEFSEATNGVKLALFDTSDPSHPKVADSMSFEDMWSAVQHDHKALLVGPDASYYAIPYEVAHETWQDSDDVIIEDAEELPDTTPESGEDAQTGKSASGSQTANSSKASAESIEDGTGILVFSAKAGKLQLRQNLKTHEPVSRCIYIGEYIYGICSNDSIEGFHLK